MLTPMDIHNKDFKRTIRGYSTNEVDEFLDRVVSDYEKLFRENDKLKEQASLNDKEITQYRKLEKNLQDTLAMAQNTADEILASAKKNAEDINTTAQKNADDLIATAQKNADDLNATAQRNADEITATAQKNATNLITTAQNNAEDLKNMAQRNADELMATTKKTVEEMKASTERECNSIREQAKLDAKRQLDEANAKLNVVMAEYERIVRDKNSFLMKFRMALEAELAMTNQMLSSVPHHEMGKVQPSVPQASETQSITPPVTSLSSLSNVPLPKITPKSDPPSVHNPQPKVPQPKVESDKAAEPEEIEKTTVFVKTPRVK